MAASQNQVVFDATALTASGIGDAGPDATAIEALADAAKRALALTIARRASGQIGFFDLPDDRDTARACMDFARDVDPNIDTVVVLGIGGSSLGPRALYSALAPAFDHLAPRSAGMPRRLFFPDNIDPVTFAALLDRLPLERTLWNVVTKSGATAETAAQLLVVADRLQRQLGPERMKRHLVCTTDPAKGALRATANALGVRAFDLPSSVGGRFSVLTPVGLLPAALAGLDVMGLLDGARRMRDRVKNAELATNPALMLAALLHHHHMVRGRPMTVMMSYVDALYDTADWFRQLWAESLGKAKDTLGDVVNVGPTPIAARGATDQHSQLQLYAEGPDDKSYLFLTVKQRATEIVMPGGALAESQDEYRYLAGRGMGELLDAELRGTRSSLVRRKRPVGTLTLERVSAEAVGELLMLLEAATAYAGPLYGVDPFDQPGVEEAKRLAFAALGRPGYEQQRDELSRMPGPDPKYVL
ncbi:MAG TPA: glucose-6-phosphate isomerase [Kofleriaceae bacterium]|jgi:glucose-6-phosphate isomerase|nr:glucose-6-phosphate isomerase [Kofleriaceae bacterium]